LSAHFRRLSVSSRMLGINYRFRAHRLKQAISRIVSINCLRDAYVRITLWQSQKGSNLLIFAKEYAPFTQKKYSIGFSAAVSDLRQDEKSLFARIKTTSRMLYELSFKEAVAKGCDESLILNNRGYLSEASRSNLFWIKDKMIYTPSLECGCLEGITRQAIFTLAKRKNSEVYEGKYTLSDLYCADEAFLTNSLIGIMPLVAIERRKIKDAKAGRITVSFIKQYNHLLKDAT
ncbi:MAG: aminotransferase class IV, partial [Candidatus Omnitrophota bacterium]